MLFNSLSFALFFPLVAGLHFLLPHRLRWVLLLVASYAFYMAWEPAYGLLLLLSTTIDYAVSLRLPGAAEQNKRWWLAVSLCSNLGLLFFFKYFNLFNGSLGGPLPMSEWLLPVGISFYTFQTIGYTIDVYRGTIQPERNFGRFALYVSYFPQLVAGPIERASRLLPQLRREVTLDWDRVASGLRLAAWGMFKKVVVADRLSVLVDAVYNDHTTFGGFAYVLATVFFAYQVYCDFSGYSDVAIGVSRVLGYDLMRNFDHPHGSRSMTEWWSRWHISLSSWFRDYIYFPLGGNRVAFPRWSLNVMLVFVISGLWHGASWRFALWGAMHGTLLVLDRATKPWRDRAAAAVGLDRVPRVRAALAIALTFLLWTNTLVPFRADDLRQVFYMYAHLGEGWRYLGQVDALANFLQRVHLDVPMFLVCLLLMPLVDLVDHLRRNPDFDLELARLPIGLRWTLDYALVFGVLFLGHWTDRPFVYFQF